MNSTIHRVKCGNRQCTSPDGYHDSSEAVKACYAKSGRFTQTPAQAAAQNAAQVVATATQDTPLPEVSVEQFVAQARARQDEQERQRAAERRGRYLAWRSIPVFGRHNRAYYALQNGEHVEFYRVDRPKTGTYAGKTFIKRQSGDSFLKMEWVEAGQALDRIAADPQAAGILYGQRSKHCYRCHRSLTDDVNKGSDGLTSLERGVGPDCAQKMGLI